MTTFDTIANAYITAWNARDADREQAVAAAFAPDATYTDPLADGPVIRRARKKERMNANTSEASPTRIVMLRICRNGASSRSRLRIAMAAPTIWSVEDRIGSR